MSGIEEQIDDMTDDELMARMAYVVRLLGTLDAVVATDGTDPYKVASWLYHDKMQILPLEEMLTVAKEYIPILEADGLIVDGRPTEEAKHLSREHIMLLSKHEQLH